MHHDSYTDLETCITLALEKVRDGHEIHIQTRDQWVLYVDDYDQKLEDAYRHGRAREREEIK
jgi:hypothetical protein